MLSMVFCTASVSGTFSSSRILTPGSFATTSGALVVRLVVAVVVLGSDVDEADGEGRVRRRRAARGAPRWARRGRALLALAWLAPDRSGEGQRGQNDLRDKTRATPHLKLHLWTSRDCPPDLAFVARPVFRNDFAGRRSCGSFALTTGAGRRGASRFLSMRSVPA